MTVPTALRKQLKAYEAKGFTARRVEPGAGSHFRVWFDQFTAPQFLTLHADDPHAIKNNIARFRRLARDVLAGRRR